ncbi:predicted protein [Histoplasma mississippiense (nom. inval.)]|uniref:predicted protein n=1 Tax=Ajellomyces capsulatus (strain NAm1 / WU24) TaxID=2059318 RepID=UPI000157C4AC|nr:predicted protein [Histoplasma mississippiense (nom. inval.)]EDN08224.1 predicted protein [Histoplasma mississippiense (nom. inval.)]
MARRRGSVVPSPIVSDDSDDSDEFMMDTDSDVDSDASGETDITTPIHHGDGKKEKEKLEEEEEEEEEEKEDEQQDIDDLAELLTENNHSPEHYLNMMQTIDLSRTECVNYAIGTLALQDRIRQEWLSYCKFLKSDAKAMYQQLDYRVLYTFFDWMLNQRRGKNGRRRQGIKRKSALNTYWKNFRTVYELEMHEKIDKDTSRHIVKNGIPVLVKKYRLSNKPRPKTTVYLDDLIRVVETTVTTTKKKFGHGRLRISLILYFQLAGFSANRPQALLSLTEFVIPEIIFDPSLILSPQVILLGLLFADGAFARLDGERILTSASQLLDLDIPEDTYQLEFNLDPGLSDIPILRRSERTLDGIRISDVEALTYNILLPWIKCIGKISTIRQIVRPYSLRYGAGKALDNSGHISDAVRSLIFQHSDPKTFLKYYLHRKVDKDVRAVVQGLDPQQQIIRAACRMIRTVNPRRPQELTTEESSSVNQQPHIKELIEKRDHLSKRLGRPIARHKGTVKYELYTRVGRELAGARQRARDKLLLEKQEKFDFEEPLREIKRQLSGIKISRKVEKSLDANTAVPPVHRRLISALLSLPRETLQDEMLRRTEAIDAVVDYCRFEEGETCRLPHDKRPGPKVFQEVKIEIHVPPPPPPPPSERDIALKAVMEDHRPLYCFICLDKFSTHGGVSKHIRRKHLQHIKPDDTISCRRCDITLDHKMHLQSHAFSVHQTVT